MIYSKIYLKKRFQIPSLVLISIVVFIIILLNFFLSKPLLPIKAFNSGIIRTKIVNISPTQLGVYWQTDKKQSGWVLYGDRENNLISLAYDERDFQENHNLYFNHYAILKNLKENTKYYYNIIGDNKILLQKNQSVITPTNFINNSNIKPAYGRVLQSNGKGLENSIVLISLKDSYDLATITKTSGEWLIPLNYFYNKSDLKLMTMSGRSLLKIEIIGLDNEISTIKTYIDEATPLPQSIIIGNNYNFTEEDVLAADIGIMNTKYNEFDIVFPKENAVVPAKSPLIKGVSIPNREITVTLKSKSVYITKVKSDKDGIWRVILTENLVSGNYQLSATTNNKENKQIEIKRNFVVAKSGEQVMGNATGEAQLTVTPSVTPTVTSTSYPSPTVKNSTYPTSIISEPISGSNFNNLIIGSTSLVIVGLGLLLAF